MDIPAQDRIRALTTAFLDAHDERIVEALSERLGQGGSASHPARPLFDLAASYLREPSHPTDLRRFLAGAFGPQKMQDLISGQIVLWSVLHRMLRDTEGLHRAVDVVHAVLALSGDTIDGIIGALIDTARSGTAASVSPGWGTLTELGRIQREFQTLHQTIHDLLHAQDPPRMFEVLQQGILGAFHIRSLLIAVVNRDEGFLEVVSAHPSSVNSRDPVGWRYDLSHPEILCDVVRTGRTEIIEGWDPRFHRRMVQPDGSLVFHQRTPEEVNPKDMAFFVPLKARDRVIGVAATGSTQAGKEIVLREIERMRPFLDQAGVTISIVSDTIKRRQAEEMLRENEARLKLALDAARMGTWDSNLLTGELIWSESMEPMFGLPPGTFSRTRDAFYECVDPEDRERVRQAVNLAIEEGTAFEVEHRIVWPNGEVRWIASKGRVFRDEMGRAGHMLGTALDITESRQAEEIQREAERTRVLVETAGAAAHEINQPLTVIIGLAQLMLMKESLDDAIRRDVESIQGAGQRIGAIVLKMQDLQKYITKPYLGESRIVDFEAATRKDP